MKTAATARWLEQNQHYLSASLTQLRTALQYYTRQQQGGSSTQHLADAAPPEPAAIEWTMPTPPALETLRTIFGLTQFERDVLLLCASVDLDSGFAALCAAAQGDSQRTYPTFSLAMAALRGAHWDALLPTAALRWWRLIEPGAGPSLTLSPLRISERVLHYLAGAQHLDERLIGLVYPVHARYELVPSHEELAEQLAATWSQSPKNVSPPALQLCGDERDGAAAVAAAVCAKIGRKLYRLAADVAPIQPAELETFARLWERESALINGALLLDCSLVDDGDAARAGALVRLIERLQGMLIIIGRERRQMTQRPTITFDIRKPSLSEQRAVWQVALGQSAGAVNGRIDALVTQFNLSASIIRTASVKAISQTSHHPDSDLGQALWDACRSEARPRMADLAQPIAPAASWDDLVLPKAQIQTLREIVDQVRQRARVYEQWGFAAKGMRGLGISALFAGQSGTGKTMAAEVLASDLRLDLYRIDLSAVVSKYIGETEKNLRRIFDAAEEGGSILLFDEADALFGKRSEVKDSHDRYANIEVSYLLQRMEAYRGLAILTTNMKNALDTAFLRRIRFIVHFPFPDAAQRAEIWRRIFPAGTPRAGLDEARLAQLNVAGGNIRNIALNAAFLAAADTNPVVRMSHLRRAAQREYAKLEKTLTEAEIDGWSDDERATTKEI